MISKSASGWICTTWNVTGVPAGKVCINAESNGYDAKYVNASAASRYFFATGNLGCARVCVYARIEGWNIFSNDVSTAGLC